MNDTMRAVMFYGPRQIKLITVPLERPGPGQALIKIEAALTCGTDFKAYRRGHKVLLGTLPSPFGHELSGVIVEAGTDVAEFKAGDRVVAANSAPCDRCFFCAEGRSQLCDNLKLHNGAYAEYNLLPASIVKRNLYHLDDRLGFAQAALAEPLACAIHAADVVNAQKNETAVIIGAGAMSLLLIAALRCRGARILVIGRNPEHLQTALQAGADETFSARDGDPVAAARRWTSGRGPDCVFEAVGAPETWRQALALVRKGGRVCLFGGCAAGTEVPLDAHRVHYEQISLYGVFHHTPKYFQAAVDLLSSGSIKTGLLISRRIELSEVPAFFESRHDQTNPKVAVIP